VLLTHTVPPVLKTHTVPPSLSSHPLCLSVLASSVGREQSPACRREALFAMARCAALGCPITVAAATKHIQDNDHDVRLAAVEVLSKIARKGDKNTIAALVSQLTGNMAKDPTQPGAFLNGAGRVFVIQKCVPPWALCGVVGLCRV